jgi:TatA/E family protein of Tat protein translocase
MPTTLLVFEFLGTTELMVIALVALIIFGPRKLPELGRTLGRSLAEFKRASEEFKRTWEYEVDTERTQTASLAVHGDVPEPVVARESLSGEVDDGAGRFDLDAEAVVTDGVPEGQTIARAPSDSTSEFSSELTFAEEPPAYSPAPAEAAADEASAVGPGQARSQDS